MLDKNGKKYLSDIFHYIGVGFIGGSISHGFFTGQRSIIMALIGIVLFIIGELLQKQNFKDISYLKILFVGVIYSISVGMINGGLQHFLDSPERSLWIIPVGFFLSLLIFPLKENTTFKEVNKNLLFLTAFSLFISSSVVLAYFLIPKDFYQTSGGHHEEASNESKQEVIENNVVGNDEKFLNTLEEPNIKENKKSADIKTIEDNHGTDGHID